MSVDGPKNAKRWYRHPVGAMAVGCVIAAGFAIPALKYGFPFGGTDILLVVILIVPALSGFVVGSMCPQHGAVWAALSSVPPISFAAFRFVLAGAESYAPDLNPETLPVIAIPALVSAVFGSLGAGMAQMPRKSRIPVTVAVLISLPVIAGACFLKAKLEMDSFKRDVLPVIARRFSENVIRLSPDAVWDVRRAGTGLGREYSIEAVTRIKGHRLYLTIAPRGSAIRDCFYGYEPPKRAQFTDEQSVRRYLADFGVSRKVIDRLRVSAPPRLSPRSWFCANELLAQPGLPTCAKRPLCGSDGTLNVLRDGTIRIRMPQSHLRHHGVR